MVTLVVLNHNWKIPCKTPAGLRADADGDGQAGPAGDAQTGSPAYRA